MLQPLHRKVKGQMEGAHTVLHIQCCTLTHHPGMPGMQSLVSSPTAAQLSPCEAGLPCRPDWALWLTTGQGRQTMLNAALPPHGAVPQAPHMRTHGTPASPPELAGAWPKKP